MNNIILSSGFFIFANIIIALLSFDSGQQLGPLEGWKKASKRIILAIVATFILLYFYKADLFLISVEIILIISTFTWGFLHNPYKKKGGV